MKSPRGTRRRRIAGSVPRGQRPAGHADAEARADVGGGLVLVGLLLKVQDDVLHGALGVAVALSDGGRFGERRTRAQRRRRGSHRLRGGRRGRRKILLRRFPLGNLLQVRLSGRLGGRLPPLVLSLVHKSKLLLVHGHLVGRDELAQLAEDEAANRTNEGHSPADTANLKSTQAEDLRGEDRHEHGNVKADLRQEDGLLHVLVAEEVHAHGLVEGARRVRADVLSPHERDEGDGARVHELVLEIGKQRNVCLKDLAIAEVHQRQEVHDDDDEGEDRAVEHHAEPHPAQDDGLLPRPGAILQDGLVTRLHTQGDRRRQVRDEDEEKDLQRRSHHGQAHADAEEDLHHLGDVDGHDEGHKLLDAGVDDAALLHGGDDRTEVVVHEDHVRSALGDLSTLDSHGHADVGLIQRGRVVDSVTGHGGHSALALQRLHDLQLVLGLSAGEDADGGRHHIHGLIVEVVTGRPQTGAVHGSNLLVVLRHQDLDVVRDSDGRLQVVTRDHHDADACTTSTQDGIRDAVAVGVDGGDEAHELHVLTAGHELVVRGDVLRVVVEGQSRHSVDGDGQHAERLAGVEVDLLHESRLVRLAQRLHGAVLLDLGAAVVEDEIRGALADREEVRASREGGAARAKLLAAGDVRDRQHHLARRGEGDLQNTLVLLLDRLFEADLTSSHHDRCLGGVALRFPLLLSIISLDLCKGRVAAENGGEEGGLHAHLLSTVSATLGPRDLSDTGVEALAAHIIANARAEHVHHGHLALSQSAGLVTADHRGRAKRLHRCQLAHEHVLLDHVTAADGERDRHTERDALRDRRHSKGHRDEDHVEPGRTVGVGDVFAVQDDTDEEDDQAHHDGKHTNTATQLVQILLQRRLAARGVREAEALGLGSAILAGNQLSNPANARTHARLHDNALALATGRAAAGEDAVLRRELLGLTLLLGLDLPRLRHVVGLSREGHLANLDVVRLDQTHVRRHNVASSQDDEVATHDHDAVNLDLHAVADDPDGGLSHLGQGVERITGLVLGVCSNGGVDDDDDHNGHAGGVRERILRLVASGVDQDGGHGRRDEQQDDEARQLHDEQHEQRRLGRLLELVRSIAFQHLLCLSGGEAVLAVGAIRSGELLGLHVAWLLRHCGHCWTGSV
mmetsp:Transcript_43354/g.94395  ORF Transcript_43354/g.94395 Transcript_43354/m.94395 type:complete len:1132 (-) Transcript_43354:88-3483(-)